MWNTCKEYDDINSTTAALGGLKTATVYGVRLNIICIDSAMLRQYSQYYIEGSHI